MIIHKDNLTKESDILCLAFSHGSEVDDRMGLNVVYNCEGIFQKKLINND